MKDQLDIKSTAKATALLLEQLEAERQQMDGAIAILRARLIRSGHDAGGFHYAARNGHAPEPERTEADAARIVKGAKAMFAERQRQSPVARRTPEQWRDAIVDLLKRHRAPVSALDIIKTLGSKAAYSHLKLALKARVIAEVGKTESKGYSGGVMLYRLAGQARRTPITSGLSLKVKAQRAKTAKLLEHFDPIEPRANSTRAQFLGILVRRGYLKSAGEGLYLRTAKPYDVGHQTATSRS